MSERTLVFERNLEVAATLMMLRTSGTGADPRLDQREYQSFVAIVAGLTKARFVDAG